MVANSEEPPKNIIDSVPPTPTKLPSSVSANTGVHLLKNDDVTNSNRLMVDDARFATGLGEKMIQRTPDISVQQIRNFRSCPNPGSSREVMF